MATILVCPAHETGHMLPSLLLAEQLRRRGHRVVIATILDLEHMVAARGFESLAILRDVYPRGHLARVERTELARLDLLQKTLWMREYDELFSGRLLEHMETIEPHVMIVDVVNTMVAMAAGAKGIPCVQYSTALAQQFGELPH